MYRVIALDPGGTTGWATYTAEKILNPAGGAEYYDEKWDCGQLGPEDHHRKLYNFLGHLQTAQFTVVCESFEFRNQTEKRDRDNIELISREYIGVTKLFAQEHVSSTLRMQTAAKAKGFIPDKGPEANKKIRKAGLWHPNHKHAMDAVRHLLFYLVNVQGRMDLAERWWKPSDGRSN